MIVVGKMFKNIVDICICFVEYNCKCKLLDFIFLFIIIKKIKDLKN